MIKDNIPFTIALTDVIDSYRLLSDIESFKYDFFRLLIEIGKDEKTRNVNMNIHSINRIVNMLYFIEFSLKDQISHLQN